MDDFLPACWSWPVTAADHEQAFLAELGGHPTREGKRLADALMTSWHAGRCAVCGSTRYPLVNDHDHDTGYLRGRLCERCNQRRRAGTGG